MAREKQLLEIKMNNCQGEENCKEALFQKSKFRGDKFQDTEFPGTQF